MLAKVLLINVLAFQLVFAQVAPLAPLASALNQEYGFKAAEQIETMLKAGQLEFNQETYEQIKQTITEKGQVYAGPLARLIVDKAPSQIKNQFLNDIEKGDENFQLNAIDGLRFHKNQRDLSLNLLSKLYQTSTSAKVRHESLVGVLYQSQGSEIEMAKSALNDKAMTKYHVIGAIKSYGKPHHIPMLIDVLRDDNDNFNRVQAAEAIEKLIKKATKRDHLKREYLISCLPDMMVEEYSDSGKQIALLVDIVLTMGLSSAAVNKGKRDMPKITPEYAKALKDILAEALI